MTLQYSVLLNNDQLNNVETFIGTNVSLLIYTGLPPTDTSDAPTGTLLVAINLPADWMAAASSETKAKSGTWSGTAVGTGTAGYFRICNGSPTADLTLDNTSITSGQTVTVSTFTITAGNR